jgi:ATP synthase protein I
MGEETPQKQASLDALNAQLEAMKKIAPDKSLPATKGNGDAAKAAIDFASATAVGCGLGFGVDYWQHTSPWGILVGLLIGCAAGVKLLFQDEARTRAANAKNKTTD